MALPLGSTRALPTHRAIRAGHHAPAPFSQFALGGFNGPAQFPARLIPTTIPSGIPASASESRICPTLTGQYRYGPVTQPHECDAHIPPLPPCHPRHAGQWSYLHRQQDPETGTPRSSVGPPRFHAPVHGPSPAIRGFPCHGQSRTFPADHPCPPPSIPTVTTSARCRISSS